MERSEEFQLAYINQEADANKHMSYVCGASSSLLILIWIFYLVGVFTIPDHFFLFVAIMFPVVALVLATPLLFVKSQYLRKPWYKYFLLFSLLAVIMAVNIIVPKHGLLLWPFAILMANHYYSQKIGVIMFISTIVAMFISIYFGMFFGEYDQNLLGGGVVIDGKIATIEGYQERFDMLHDLMLKGDNRYVKVLVYYYLPRAAMLSLFFLVSTLLNKRNYALLFREVKIHDEQEKARTELDVAKGIQLSTLPAEFVSTKDVEIIGELKAANEIGGDFYDYVKLDDNHVALIIGDVSGKGVPAAMFMMKTITCFRDFARPGKTPSEILKEMNTSIYRGNNNTMFVTCFLAILDIRNGQLIYANAGHNPPLIGKPKGFSYLKCASGFLLGCFKDAFIKDEETFLAPGEEIILYTDGITEARNPDGAFFGIDHLLHVVNKNNYTSILELHHALKDEIAVFVKDAPQSDDITFVTLKYQGGRYSLKERTFDANKTDIAETLTFIESFGHEHHFPEDFINKLLVVGDEILSNIAIHGYQNKGGEIFVRLIFNEDTNEFAITVIDKAKQFNQLEVNSKPYDEDTAKTKIGGLGIFIVKNIMSEYAYDYINGKNILVLKKKF